MKNILRAARRFPYKGIHKLLFLEYLPLKAFQTSSFPSMSLIPYVMKHYHLKSTQEFYKRYEASRVGFDALWASKPRTNAQSIASFYNEHDADLWRQAVLSREAYVYKKKILFGYHVAKRIHAKNVLDYGCGAAAASNYLVSKGYTVSVADIPSPTLEFVRKELSFKEIITITPDLVLEDTYDYIMCLDALEHTLTPLEIMKNLMKSLRSGGYLYVNFPVEHDFDPNSSHPHTREAQIERPATFKYLRSICEELVPESIYRKLK